MRAIQILGLAVLLTASAAAQDRIELDSYFCRDYFFVGVTLADREGYAEDRTLWFVHDTGASNSFVDPDAIERVSGRNVRNVNRINITGASSGDVSINRMPARVRELDHLANALGRPVDGIMGVRVFDDFLMTLDYAQGGIYLERGELPLTDNNTIFSTRGRDRRPWLRVRLPDGNRRLLIDSGAGRSFINISDLDDVPLMSDPVWVGSAFRLNRIERRMGGRVDGDLAFGDVVFENPLIQNTVQSEIIGGELMRHFNWTFDQRNNRVRITRIEGEGPIPVPPDPALGMTFGYDPRGLEVTGFVAGSLAQEAGLEVGDVLTHFNGEPVTGRSCDTALEGAGSIRVTRLRDGESAVVEVPFVVLVE